MTSPSIDLYALSLSSIKYPIEPAATVTSALKCTPFISVPGTFNLRDLGAFPSSPITNGRIYRSGALQRITPEGAHALRHELGIQRVFDLRSSAEREKSPSPDLLNVDIETVWVPSKADANWLNQLKVETDEFAADEGNAFVKLYGHVLENYGPAYREILIHIRDRPCEALLYHCTAGKDRTGVLSALLLALAGCPREKIAEEYILTRIGMEPVRLALVEILKTSIDDFDFEKPGMAEMVGVSEKGMLAVLQHIDEEYDGVEGYLIQCLEFAKEDVSKIKRNLVS